MAKFMIVALILPTCGGIIFEKILYTDLDVGFELFDVIQILFLFGISYIFEYENEILKERCMGMKMNKSSFIKELSKKTRYDEKTCILINEIIEKYFIFNKKNKEKLIQDLKNNVNLNEDDAENIYDISIKIIKQEIKNKLKHPFRSQD